MTISVWRYSHLALAVSSFLLLTLASVTGIILSFEPLREKAQPYRVKNVEDLRLANTLPLLREHYPGISELTVDRNLFVQIKGSDANGEKLLAYVDPHNGRMLGTPQPQSEFFKWVTSLHRSLFAHETGRLFMGLTAFLLLLITLSGILLVIQRQRGVKRFFARIAKENFAQYYHVVLGRLALVPILVIALSGTWLSLERFHLLPGEVKIPPVNEDDLREQPKKDAALFEVFRDTRLSEVESVEFPFSEFPEDYYTLKLKDRELTVNQVTGDVLSQVNYPTAVLLTRLSLDLHTGRASAVWAVILAIASANILFFIYSGFAMTFARRANRVKNKFTAAESRIILLVGSENGATFRFAKAVHQQLLKQGERSFLAELNQYQLFPKAEHLVLMTATYGQGDAPTNASRFASLLQKHPQQQPLHYSVLGFGSQAYPDFCQFAFHVNLLLSQQSWATALTDVHTVNDKSPDDFQLWAETWSQQTNIPLTVLPELYRSGDRLHTFTVTRRTPALSNNGTFLLSLRAGRRPRVTSGDLLVVYPKNDHRERLYSIGVVDKELRLSVRLHPNGLGSGFLHGLSAGDRIRARVIRNTHFHFPAKAREVILISNGTGIAPFIGMISQNKRRVHCTLYCGFREHAGFAVYESFLQEQLALRRLARLQVALSREDNKQYVNHLVARDGEAFARTMHDGGVILLCGSLAMQKDVMKVLDEICHTLLSRPLSFYQSRAQLLSDCY